MIEEKAKMGVDAMQGKLKKQHPGSYANEWYYEGNVDNASFKRREDGQIEVEEYHWDTFSGSDNPRVRVVSESEGRKIWCEMLEDGYKVVKPFWQIWHIQADTLKDPRSSMLMDDIHRGVKTWSGSGMSIERNYLHVASVSSEEVSSIEVVFELCNNGVPALYRANFWQNNPEVFATYAGKHRGKRSMMPMDIVKDPNGFWHLCMPTGWKDITNEVEKDR